MNKSKEKGFIQAVLLLLLVVGLGVGVYLVQTRTGWFSKAAPVTPDKPETSFELEAQADTAEPFADVTALKSVGVGQKFRVDVWVRSDIDAANLFAAKLKFPTDLLQVVEVNKRGTNSFVNHWITDPSFDNSSGDISIIGGVNPPGLLTSTQSSGSVKGTTSTPTAGVGTVSGTRSVKAGESVDFRADLVNPAQSGQIWVTKLPDGKSDFTCPGGMIINSKQEKWCKVAEGKGPTLGGNFTFRDWGSYIVTVNAFANEQATYTGNAATQCSGNPLSSGSSGNDAWSNCGSGSNFTLNVAPVPPSSTISIPPPPPALTATSCLGETVEGGDAIFRSSYTDQDGNLVKIYDIKSGGKAKVTAQTTPPGAYINWKIAPFSQYLPDGGGTLTPDPDNPAVVTYTAPNNPTSEAQGAYVRGDYSDNPWKACPPVNFAVKPATSNTQVTLMVPRLIASIIFEAKKAGNANIDFTDGSQILRNSDSLNIISAKKGLKLVITAVPTYESGSTCDINALATPINPNEHFDNPLTVQFAYAAKYKISKYVTGAQWDFEGDNKWDTDMSLSNGTIAHVFSKEGSYNVKLQLQMSDGEITPVCSKTVTVPIVENLSCLGVYPVAQLGKLAGGEDIYIVDSGSKTRMIVQFQPYNAQVEWKIASNSRNLPDGGKFTTPNLSATDYIAPINTSVSSEGVTIRPDLTLGRESVSCKSVTLAIKPAGQVNPPSTSAPSTGQPLRHDGDINGDSKINLVDMSRLLSQFGKSVQSEADLNGDEVVNTIDIILLRNILIKNGTLNNR